MPVPTESTQTAPATFYNLEAIDLAIQDQPQLSFVFNNKKLDAKSGLHMSDDIIVYRTTEGKWKATVIGPGGIESALAIKSQNIRPIAK